MKRIEKKRIRKKTAILGVVVDFIIAAEQVLVDGVPMVKVEIDWDGTHKTLDLWIVKDSNFHFPNERTNPVITPNEDPATWQDFFGCWVKINPGIEIKDLSVDV